MLADAELPQPRRRGRVQGHQHLDRGAGPVGRRPAGGAGSPVSGGAATALVGHAARVARRLGVLREAPVSDRVSVRRGARAASRPDATQRRQRLRPPGPARGWPALGWDGGHPRRSGRPGLRPRSAVLRRAAGRRRRAGGRPRRLAPPRSSLPEAQRLRLVLLVHMPFETPREAALLGAAAAVVTTSDWTRRWLVEQYGLDHTRLHVASGGGHRGPGAGHGGGW